MKAKNFLLIAAIGLVFHKAALAQLPPRPTSIVHTAKIVTVEAGWCDRRSPANPLCVPWDIWQGSMDSHTRVNVVFDVNGKHVWSIIHSFSVDSRNQRCQGPIGPNKACFKFEGWEIDRAVTLLKAAERSGQTVLVKAVRDLSSDPPSSFSGNKDILELELPGYKLKRLVCAKTGPNSEGCQKWDEY